MMWINIIAIIVAPIAAVWIGQMLQDRAEKRRDKVAVFKAVMTYRYGWSQEAVLALNSIPIVFAEDKTVRALVCAVCSRPCDMRSRMSRIGKEDTFRIKRQYQ